MDRPHRQRKAQFARPVAWALSAGAVSYQVANGATLLRAAWAHVPEWILSLDIVMKTTLKRSLAPSVASALKLAYKTPLPMSTKRRLWTLANSRFLHYDIAVLGETCFGDKIVCHFDDIIQKHIAIFGMWEPKLTAHIVQKARVPGLFLDIGANIGYFSLLASHIYEHVIAFEPSPSTFAALERNFQRNSIVNATAYQIAVSDERGKLPFYKSAKANSGASSLIFDGTRAFEAEVECRPLQDVLSEDNWRRTQFIKIDVEGAEPRVVRSLLRSIDLLPKHCEILLEYNCYDRDLQQTFETLRRCGFNAFDLHSRYSLEDYLVGPSLVFHPIVDVPREFTDCLFIKTA